MSFSLKNDSVIYLYICFLFIDREKTFVLKANVTSRGALPYDHHDRC